MRWPTAYLRSELDVIWEVFFSPFAEFDFMRRAFGGTLYPGALSGSDGPASTYLDMIRHNATTLTQSLGS